jgi:hypothetical protein
VRPCSAPRGRISTATALVPLSSVSFCPFGLGPLPRATTPLSQVRSLTLSTAATGVRRRLDHSSFWWEKDADSSPVALQHHDNTTRVWSMQLVSEKGELSRTGGVT